MTDDNAELIQRFVATFERLDDLTTSHDAPLPSELSAGIDPDDWNVIRWRPAPIEALSVLYDRIPGRLPRLYELLILSYRWLEVDLQICRLLANPPAADLQPLVNRMFADPVLNNTLVRSGYVRFALAPDACYDPICFDLNRNFDGDCPVVRFNHESMLMHDSLGEAEQLFDSFRDLMLAVLAIDDRHRSCSLMAITQDCGSPSIFCNGRSRNRITHLSASLASVRAATNVRAAVRFTEFTLTTPVSTTFTFTRDEYVLAMKRHYQSTLKVGRDVAGGVLAMAGGTYLLASTDLGWLAWLLLVAGAVLLAMVGYALFLLPSMIYRSQPKLRDQYSLTFSDDGIAFKTDSIDATLQWSLYHSWLSDNDFYIMHHGKRDVSVIPRRSLTDGDDVRLRELLTKNIGPPKA